jgi:hypothetical protein
MNDEAMRKSPRRTFGGHEIAFITAFLAFATFVIIKAPTRELWPNLVSLGIVAAAMAMGVAAFLRRGT